jgi:multiple sugar transport system substrate-binding protein
LWAIYSPPLAASLVFLVGCNSNLHAGPTEIVYWTGWSGHEYETQKGLIEEFNRTHPQIRVRMLTQFSSTGSYQKVRIAFAGGATPDLMSTIWDRDLAGYAMRRVLEPLNGYMARSGRDLDREYTPGMARMLRIDGRVYGLTVTTSTNFIAYNKQIFREAGLNPEMPPQTTDELDKAAKACSKFDTSGNMIRYGFKPVELGLWAYVFGGQWYDTTAKKITANNPHNVAALTWMAHYAKMFDLRKIQAFTASFGENESANGPFFTGRMAMWITGEWSEEFIHRYAPKMEWGWFALPYPPKEGRPNVTRAASSIFVIPKACKHKEAAWEFLNWLTSPHAVTKFCSAIKNVPPLIEAGKDPMFQNDPLLKFAVAISQGKNSFGAPPIPIWGTYRREIDRAEEAAVMGGGDPQKLLDDLQRRMERELARTMEELGR